MPTALDVRMRQFVNQHDTWLAGEDGVHVHFFKYCPLKVEFAGRNSIDPARQFRDSLAAVALHYANGNIFAAAGTANGLA